MTKKEVQELKEIYKKNEEQIKKINLLTNSLKENIEEAQKEEIYPSSSKGTTAKIIKKINIKKAKEDFNKLIEEPSIDIDEIKKEDIKIYKQYEEDLNEAVRKAIKKNPHLHPIEVKFDVNQEVSDKFINKYGLHPGEFLKKYKLKYSKKYRKQQKAWNEIANFGNEYAKEAELKNAIKNIIK
jgi:hypothetical protein